MLVIANVKITKCVACDLESFISNHHNVITDDYNNCMCCGNYLMGVPTGYTADVQDLFAVVPYQTQTAGLVVIGFTGYT